MELPSFLSPLFWEHRPGSIDSDAHAQLVLERVLEYGSLQAVRWALATYGSGRIEQFLRDRGVRVLSRKTLSFWIVLLGLEDDECFATSSLTSSRPYWDY